MGKQFRDRFFTDTDAGKAQAITTIRELPRGYMVQISKAESLRTLAQNALMHVLFRQVAEYSGHSEGEVKEHLKRMFLGTRQYEFMGVVHEVSNGTANLGVKRTHDLLLEIMAWMGDAGMDVDYSELERTVTLE